MKASLQPAIESLVRDFDPNRLTQEVVRLGEEWADYDAAAASLEETKKTLLARLVMDYVHNGASGSLGERPKQLPISQAEYRAASDPRYEQHLELMVAARQEAHRARVRYDMGKMRLELMRSLQATMRNEMRLSGNMT